MKTLIEYLFRRNKIDTASVARERLSIIVAREGRSKEAPTYLPQLKRELLQVLAKYEKINLEQVTVNVENQGDCEVLELNVILGDERNVGADAGTAPQKSPPTFVEEPRAKVTFPSAGGPRQAKPSEAPQRGVGREFPPVVPGRPAGREATPFFDRPAPVQENAGPSPS